MGKHLTRNHTYQDFIKTVAYRRQCPFQNPSLTHFPSLAPVALDGNKAKQEELNKRQDI